MRVLVLVLIAAFAGGCTSVRMVQREGCWIKQTEKRPFKRVREEIGPCTRAQPRWVEDRLTRLVQECVAQADYRWQVRALEAWSKAKPYPAQPPHEEILRTCMEEARVGIVGENEELKRRVTQLSAERESMQQASEEDRAHLRSSHDEIAKYLGEAANRPAPPAVATATASSTSDGNATNENGATLASDSSSGSGASGAPASAVAAPAPAAPAPATPAPATPAVVPASPAAGPTTSAPRRPAKIVRARRAPSPQAVRPVACEPSISRAARSPCEVPAEGRKADARP